MTLDQLNVFLIFFSSALLLPSQDFPKPDERQAVYDLRLADEPTEKSCFLTCSNRSADTFKSG